MNNYNTLTDQGLLALVCGEMGASFSVSYGNTYWRSAGALVRATEYLCVMAMAEALLSDEQLGDYGCALVSAIKPYFQNEPNGEVHWGKLVHATFRQRAIAWLTVKKGQGE